MVRYNTGLWHTLGSAFWLGRAIGRRPNHCSTRCNRTNRTACGSRLGPLLLHCMGEDPRRSATRLHASKQALRHASRAFSRRSARRQNPQARRRPQLNSDLKSGQPRIDKTQSPSSVDHLRVLCGRRRCSNLVARRRSRDKQPPIQDTRASSLCLTLLWQHR